MTSRLILCLAGQVSARLPPVSLGMLLVLVSILAHRDLGAPGRVAAGGQLEAPTVTSSILDNGLAVLTLRRPSSHAVAIAVGIRLGSRDEDDPSEYGVTNLLGSAHLLGIPSRPTEAGLRRAFTITGGSLNVSVGRTLTVFSAYVPADYLDTALSLVGEIIVEPLLPEEAVEREKVLIAQDIARRATQPSALVQDLLFQTLFQGTSLAHNPNGDPAAIGATSPLDLRAWREKFFVPRNMAVAVVGAVDHDQVVEMVQQAFDGLPVGDYSGLPAALSAPPGSQRLEGTAGQQQAEVAVGVALPGSDSEDWYPLLVMDNILGGASGRIFEEIRTRRSLAYVAGSFLVDLGDRGVWIARAGTDPSNANMVVDLIKDEMGKIIQEPPREEEVERAKGALLGRETRSLELNSAQASRLVSRYLLGRLETTQDLVESVRQISPEDVARVAAAYLDPEAAITVVVGPGSESGSGASGALR